MQILNFLLNIEMPEPIMSLWCKRQVQMFIDEIQNEENSEFIIKFYNHTIKPVRFKLHNWDKDDNALMGLFPLTMSGKLSRKDIKNFSKLIRMIFFIGFFATNNPKNQFTGKFEFISDKDAVKIFKSIYFKEDENITHHSKRRQTV